MIIVAARSTKDVPLEHLLSGLPIQCNARGLLVDLDAALPIRWVRWANLASGHYECFRCEPRAAKARGLNLRDLVYPGKARLHWTPTANLPEVQAPAPDARTSETPAGPTTAEAVHQLRRRLFLFERVPCDRKGCNRWADWRVAEEMEQPPTAAGDRLFERAQLVRVKHWCSWHYQAPKLLDAKGDVVLEHEVSARPD